VKLRTSCSISKICSPLSGSMMTSKVHWTSLLSSLREAALLQLLVRPEKSVT
jgi:hypothetical protein